MSADCPSEEVDAVQSKTDKSAKWSTDKCQSTSYSIIHISPYSQHVSLDKELLSNISKPVFFQFFSPCFVNFHTICLFLKNSSWCLHFAERNGVTAHTLQQRCLCFTQGSCCTDFCRCEWIVKTNSVKYRHVGVQSWALYSSRKFKFQEKYQVFRPNLSVYARQCGRALWATTDLSVSQPTFAVD